MRQLHLLHVHYYSSMSALYATKDCHEFRHCFFRLFSAEQVRSWFFRVVMWRRLVCYRRLVQLRHPTFKVQDVQNHLDPCWILGQLYLKKWFHKFSQNVDSNRTHSRNSPERRRRKILNLIYETCNCHPTESTVLSMNMLPCNHVIRISCSWMSSQTNRKVTVLYSRMISKNHKWTAIWYSFIFCFKYKILKPNWCVYFGRNISSPKLVLPI